MKKPAILLAFILCLCALSTPASAEARSAPEDMKVTSDTQTLGVETVYRKYDIKFYDEASSQPGTVERIEYTTDVYGEPIDTWANVYLPYAYDPGMQYNIIYFMHGTNENQDSFIGEARVKNALDNMIEVGICEPFIMVCPTYYYDYETRATDHDLFVNEVREDLMPAVETKYSTFAQSADEAGFTASRTHRAICGYSQGGGVTLILSYGMFDYAKWFLPLSSAGNDSYRKIKAAFEQYPEYADDVFYYFASGGKRDLAAEGVTALVQELLTDEDFSYGTDPNVNNFYYCLATEVHQTLMSRFYLYNAFDVLFR